ncbi:flagellar FliJ family protein [Vogesella oryzae]|uniref:flagellar FliJ family protein n=1 Tax=Vogesella oryzae TaxID=1735285 RepID=UPI001583FCC5|nr:flagellar FliJ family protein [Vogesella oryzae]
MNPHATPANLQSLARLVALRQDEVAQLGISQAQKEALRQRYRNNLSRMAALCAGSGSSGALPPALAMNCANYKHGVLVTMAQHQQELALHEADMAVSQRKLQQLTRQCEVLDHSFRQRRSAWQLEQQRGEQKRQDDMATQVWLQGRA